MREDFGDSPLQSAPRRLTLIRAEYADFVTQAAETTGFDVRVEEATDTDRLAVVSYEPTWRDHREFWQEYDRLKAAAALETEA